MQLSIVQREISDLIFWKDRAAGPGYKGANKEKVAPVPAKRGKSVINKKHSAVVNLLLRRGRETLPRQQLPSIQKKLSTCQVNSNLALSGKIRETLILFIHQH